MSKIKVTNASKLLLTASNELVKSPKAMPSKVKLTEAIKGIFNGTTEVLYSFDDAEVRVILRASDASQKQLNSLSNSNELSVDDIQETCNSMSHLAGLTSARVEELLYPSLRAKLQACVDTLANESPLLISACKSVITSPSNTEAKKTLMAECFRFIDTCKEISILVKFREEPDEIKKEVKHKK